MNCWRRAEPVGALVGRGGRGSEDGGWWMEDGEDAGKGLLPDVIDDIRRQEAGAELDCEEFREIGDEVLLGGVIPSLEALHIGLVECVQLHWLPLSLRRQKV